MLFSRGKDVFTLEAEGGSLSNGNELPPAVLCIGAGRSGAASLLAQKDPCAAVRAQQEA